MTINEKSYRPERHEGGLSGATARLDAQAALTWTSECKILERANTSSAEVVVELGCGNGAFLRRIQAQYSNVEIIGVDNDERLIEEASNQMPSTRFLLADIGSVPLENGCADVVLMRYVLQHLADPRPALLEAIRILRPGGRCVMFEVDGGLWGLATPYLPEIERLQSKIWSSQATRGGNRMIGRRLRRSSLEAGFADAVLDLYHYSSEEFGLSAFGPLLDPQQHVDLVEDGVITPTEMARATAAYARWLRDPASFVLMVGFAVTAVKRSDD